MRGRRPSFLTILRICKNLHEIPKKKENNLPGTLAKSKTNWKRPFFNFDLKLRN